LLDHPFRALILHRLNSPPCAVFAGTCKCGIELSSDPGHFHSCKVVPSAEWKRRHDLVVAEICRLAREAGVPASREISFPTGSCVAGTRLASVRVDAVLSFSDGDRWIDVTVTHPLKPSGFRENAKGPTAAEAVQARAKILQ
jgi:hypothetical protein